MHPILLDRWRMANLQSWYHGQGISDYSDPNTCSVLKQIRGAQKGIVVSPALWALEMF